jgi:hypothetical protein
MRSPFRRPSKATQGHGLAVGPYWLRARSRDGTRYLPASVAVQAPAPDPDPDPDPVPEESMWRECINVTDEAYGATGDGTTNDLPAVLLARAAAKAASLPLYFPAGEYRLEFTTAYTEDGTGCVVIDWPNAEIFGDGIDKTIIRGVPSDTPLGRVLSVIDRTIPRGVVETVGVDQVTLVTAADLNNFTINDSVYFSASADGSNPKVASNLVDYPHLLCHVGSKVTATKRLNIGNMNLLVQPVPGDYIFIKDRVTLGAANDYLKWSAGMGVSFSTTADGLSLRATETTYPVKVHAVQASNNAIVLHAQENEVVDGIAEGDYLVPRANFAVFRLDLPADAATTAYNYTFRDLTVYGVRYGADLPDVTGAVSAYCIYHKSDTGVVSVPYKVLMDRVGSHESSAGFVLTDTGTPSCTLHLESCEFDGNSVSVGMYTDADNLACRFIANHCDFLSTALSHHCYIHPTVALEIDHCWFDDTAGRGEAIDHFGQSRMPLLSSVTNCHFGSLVFAHAYLTSTNGSFTFAGNIVENQAGVGVRCGGNILGNTFRPNTSGTDGAECITTYSGYDNAHVTIVGNTFDMSKALGSGTVEGVSIESSGRWTIAANEATCNRPTGTGNTGPYPWSGTFIFTNVQTDALGGVSEAPPDITVSENKLTFDTSAGSQSLVVCEGVPNIDVLENTMVGTCTSTRGAIEFINTGVYGGKVRVQGNRVRMEQGDCFSTSAVAFSGGSAWAGATAYTDGNIRTNNGRVYVCITAGTSAASGGPTTTSANITDNQVTWRYVGESTPTFDIVGNNFTATAVNRVCIDFQGTNASVNISNNRLATAAGDVDNHGIRIASLAASSVRGSGNIFDVEGGLNFANIQGLRSGPGVQTIVAATNIDISPDCDTFYVTAGAPTTIHRLSFDNMLQSQRGFNGCPITLIFGSADITLGSGTAATAWVSGTPYSVGDIRTNASRLYICTVAGTAGATGPNTTALDIVDGAGTLRWKYIDEGASFANITATGGARTVGTACRLVYSATLGKWIET